MDQRLKAFFQNLMHQAIHSAIFAAFWKMPLRATLVILALLIGVVVFFKLY